MDEKRRAAVDYMLSLRGRIINGFAQLEFVLADMIDRANGLPEYETLKGPLPMGISNRALRVRALLDVEGRLSPWANQIFHTIESVLELEELRHYLAHGYCRFNWSKGGYEAMTFTRYAPPTKGGVATQATLRIERSEMEALAERVGAKTNEMLRQFREIHRSLGWMQSGLEPQVITLAQIYPQMA